MIDISASRSCGGTRPAASGSVVAMPVRLTVLRDDHVDVSAHVTVQLERNLVLAQRLDGLLQVDLVAIDLDTMLRLQSRRDVLVGDRTKGLVLRADLQAHDHGLVADLIGDSLGVGAVLRLAFDRCIAQPLGLGLGSLSSGDGQLAPKQEVAAVSVGDLLDIAGAPDILNVLRQQDPQFTRPPTWIDIRRGGGLANGFDRRRAPNRAWRLPRYPAHHDPTRSVSPSTLPRARPGSQPGTLR